MKNKIIGLAIVICFSLLVWILFFGIGRALGGVVIWTIISANRSRTGPRSVHGARAGCSTSIGAS